MARLSFSRGATAGLPSSAIVGKAVLPFSEGKFLNLPRYMNRLDGPIPCNILITPQRQHLYTAGQASSATRRPTVTAPLLVLLKLLLNFLNAQLTFYQEEVRAVIDKGIAHLYRTQVPRVIVIVYMIV